MWNLFLLVVLIGGALLFAAHGLQAYGVIWAAKVCTVAGGFCDRSDAAALAAASAALLYYVAMRRAA